MRSGGGRRNEREMKREIERGVDERNRGEGVHLQDTGCRGSLLPSDKEEKDLLKDATLPQTNRALRGVGPHHLRGDSLLSIGSDQRSL